MKNLLASARRLLASLGRYVTRPNEQSIIDPEKAQRVSIPEAAGFLTFHVGCVLLFWVGWSWQAVTVAAIAYLVRFFTITAFYHRYFSHRTFKTWRIVQFVFGVLGCSTGQRGPLWWAAHHRHHHAHSDDEHDLHSPRQHGVVWSHCGWFMTPDASRTNFRLIPDFAKYPELRLLDRFDIVVPFLLGLFMYGLGELIGWTFPDSEVTGLQMLTWGLFVSTVACYHVTFLVNSATHLIGSRRYQTKDDSRNSVIIALLTMGEGWHNNHHHYPNSTRQGFFWWEIDVTFYGLKLMQLLGLVWDIRPVPKRVLAQARKPVVATPAVPAPVRA